MHICRALVIADLSHLSFLACNLSPSMTYATALKRQLLSSSTLRLTTQLPSASVTEADVAPLALPVLPF